MPGSHKMSHGHLPPEVGDARSKVTPTLDANGEKEKQLEGWYPWALWVYSGLCTGERKPGASAQGTGRELGDTTMCLSNYLIL